MSLARPLCALALVATLSSRAIASPEPDEEEEPVRVKVALFELTIALAIPSIYYWNTRDGNNVDLDLGWDWESWKGKLTLDHVRFDTNSWGLNGFRHPLMSVVNYQIARTNGFGIVGSTVLGALYGVLWEFVIENREYPAVNDLIVHTVVGAQLGEPLWQIGQLWRGGVLTTGDRIKTTLFSPIDGMHDVLRTRQSLWWRPRAWRSIVLGVGAGQRWFDDARAYEEVVLSADIDVVRDRRYVSSGPQVGAIKPGTWSRVAGRLRLGDVDGSAGQTGILVQSRTALAGVYRQDDEGNGTFTGIGTGFVYRRDWLDDARDHVAIMQLVGPQLQVSRRRPGYAVRWDAAAYADYAMIDAHVFVGGNPFPRPPPNISVLQAHGYYNALGGSGTTRLRLDTHAWRFDAEIEGHKLWQIDAGDRVDADEHPEANRFTAHDVSDARVYWRAEVAYQPGRLGFAAAAEGSLRRGAWKELSRSSSELSVGVSARLDL